jgi:DNA-binding NarL/FixJ family response regulator
VTGWARVVVADDHPVFRAGLRVLLEDIGVEVLGEAEDGEQAVALAHETHPDVVLMDLQMPCSAAWPRPGGSPPSSPTCTC